MRAVDDVSLEIKKKEYVSILGPSGCGKSTMMHLIGLLEVPSSGKLLLEGKDVSRLSDDDLSEIRNRKVGFVFQSFNLINKFTIWENVLMPTRYTRSKIGFNAEKCGRATKGLEFGRGVIFIQTRYQEDNSRGQLWRER